MIILEDRIPLHLLDGRRIPVDPQEIYLLEAEGGETLVRTRHVRRSASRIAVTRFARQFHRSISDFSARAVEDVVNLSDCR